jgi:hypothetical protein
VGAVPDGRQRRFDVHLQEMRPELVVVHELA